MHLIQTVYDKKKVGETLPSFLERFAEQHRMGILQNAGLNTHKEVYRI
jgi:hypothetical protein